MKNLKPLFLLLLAFVSINTFAQKENKKAKKNKDIKLNITVKDENNKPVAGAFILFDDVRHPRRTNSKGIFKIKLDKSPKIISAFSPKIGIKKIKYNGKKNMLITIRGGKDSYVVNTSNNKVASTMQFNNIYDYLRGKVTGLHIYPNNTIKIRGTNSINGSTTPLFVLNGIPVDQDIFGNVVPTTIKSVVVLKGPETATYGLRGANGVIKVTTM